MTDAPPQSSVYTTCAHAIEAGCGARGAPQPTWCPSGYVRAPCARSGFTDLVYACVHELPRADSPPYTGHTRQKETGLRLVAS